MNALARPTPAEYSGVLANGNLYRRVFWGSCARRDAIENLWEWATGYTETADPRLPDTSIVRASRHQYIIYGLATAQTRAVCLRDAQYASIRRETSARSLSGIDLLPRFECFGAMRASSLAMARSMRFAPRAIREARPAHSSTRTVPRFKRAQSVATTRLRVRHDAYYGGPQEGFRRADAHAWPL
jgi:hypothetical protein